MTPIIFRSNQAEVAGEEGRQINQKLSLFSRASISPALEDINVYTLDAKIRGVTDPTLLPTPRHSFQSMGEADYRVHLGNNIPTIQGFVGQSLTHGSVSFPSDNIVQDRNTFDTIFNGGVAPVLKLGTNTIEFNPGLQFTLRRDTLSPRDMNQNLLREYLYVSTSSFFNWVSLHGSLVRETGPFTDQDLHSRDASANLEFTVGRPWGKTELLVGYSARDLLFRPLIREYYTTSSYIGVQHTFGNKFTAAVLGEYLRSWQVRGLDFAIAQAMRPAARFEYRASPRWNVQGSFALSRGEGFHAYDNVQSEFLVSYTRKVQRTFDDGSGPVPITYPSTFSFGLQQQMFYEFPGSRGKTMVRSGRSFHSFLIPVLMTPAEMTPAQAPLPERDTGLPVLAPALRSKLVSGSLLLLAGSGLVSVMNLLYNIVVARMLGPTGFGDATAVYTLLMLGSAITLSFQIVCAKLVAKQGALEDQHAVYKGLHRQAWVVGIGIGVLLVLARGVVSRYLNLSDSRLVVLLALGMAFYVPLGARRGWTQGTCQFQRLALNFVLEGSIRLLGAFVLIKLGMGVPGAVIASAAAVILAYCFAPPGVKLGSDAHGAALSGPSVAGFREGLQATVFFAGQVIINNFDIVLVKHFFPSREAGLYAAVALVGRLVNTCSWSVVNAMFPVSASSREDREGRPVLMMSLGMVVAILSTLIFGIWLVPSFLWKTLFGLHFDLVGYSAISGLLVLYAVTSGIYSLSSVTMAYEMSRKIANTSWLQLAFSGALVFGIYMFHSTLRQVIEVQLVLMSVLLLFVLVPVLRQGTAPLQFAPSRIHPLGPLSEEEVIAEFLKSEFHHPEFDEYREHSTDLVETPNFDDVSENAWRRAMLFVRRGPMWRELPKDTQWHECEFTVEDLDRVRVFPRAQWRKIARGDFYLTSIVARVRARMAEQSSDPFFRKLSVLSTKLLQTAMDPTVILIGVDADGPLTILDGNHRVVAAMLTGNVAVMRRFRIICGFSPSMTQCCWYQTNVTTLLRYAKNLVRHMLYDPKVDIRRLLHNDE